MVYSGLQKKKMFAHKFIKLTPVIVTVYGKQYRIKEH